MLKPTDLHDETNLTAPFEAELASALGTIEQPTVSYHLSLLYAGGVVYLAREEGRYKYYRIKPHTLDNIRSILGQLGQ